MGKRCTRPETKAMGLPHPGRPGGPQWQDAIRKAKVALGLDMNVLHSRCDTKSGRYWHDASKNFILAQLLDRHSRTCGHQKSVKYWKSLQERTQLDRLNKLISHECKIKAGLNQPHLYSPGKDEREDSKLVNAAVFFLKPAGDSSKAWTSRRGYVSTLAQHVPQSVELGAERIILQAAISEVEHAQISYETKVICHDVKVVEQAPSDRVDQAMVKIDKWASAWLAGEIGTSDLAWESLEYCLHMPDVLEEGEVVE